MFASYNVFSQLNTTIIISSSSSRSLYIIIMLCAQFLSHFHADVHLHVIHGRTKKTRAACSSAQLPAVAAISCCRVQFFWCDVKCLGTCCVFSGGFSLIPTSNWQSWNLWLLISLLPRVLCSLFLCLQLQMKALCFFLFFPLWPSFSFLSASKQRSTSWQAEEFSDNIKKQIRQSGRWLSRGHVNQGRTDREKAWWGCG